MRSLRAERLASWDRRCLPEGWRFHADRETARQQLSGGLEIVEAGQAADRIVAVGYSTRFRDSTRLLKTLLDENYFGTIRRFVHRSDGRDGRHVGL